MPDRDPFDELDELLSDGAPAAVVVRAAAPHVVPAMHAEPARALADVSNGPVDDEPAMPLLRQLARFASKMAGSLEAQFDRGELDASDVMNLLPKVHKAKIDEEKVELQRTGGRVDLPTIHFTIGLAGQIRAECKPTSNVEVVDAAKVVEWMPADETPEPAHAWAINFKPIDGAFEP